MAELTAISDVLAAKDRFVATVSHQLRTPLTGVLGLAEVLHAPTPDLTDEERTELSGAIADQAAELAGIIDDLLVLGRSQHGTLTVLAVPVDLREQIAKVLDERTLTSGVVIGAEQPAIAVADPGRVRQIVRNLINNAVFYGGPSIRVRIERIEDRVAVEVIDNGPGIEAEHGDRIFEPYYFAHSTFGTPDSMGIGLSVSRTLARRMGGDITHRRQGEQTIFCLTLPAVNPDTNLGGLRPNAAEDGRPSDRAAPAILGGRRGDRSAGHDRRLDTDL